MNSPLSEVTWALTRFVFGVSLALFHGYGKIFEGKVQGLTNTVAGMGFPAPSFFAWAASIAEFFGGILVALGFLTRPAAAMCAATVDTSVHPRSISRQVGSSRSTWVRRRFQSCES